MSKPLAIVIGFIGKLPLAGMSLYNLHYVAGIQDLGYDVHYIERQNEPDNCYNPTTCQMTDDCSYALQYLDRVLADFGIGRERYSFVDRADCCHGSGWPALRDAIDQADFVLALCEPTWFDELARCTRRAFVDGDPLFTQLAMLAGDGSGAATYQHYETLFTYGARMGLPGCTIPSAGREWIATRPVVTTRLWDPTPIGEALPITNVMNWAAWKEVRYKGQVYGQKNREFERFINLPQRTSQSLVLAIGGPVPRRRLQKLGWHLVDATEKTITIEAYQNFIAGSRADFGIAKHAYVASRSGWFSDRSTCYLAAGRPVVHQDTGCGDWLPTGEGVLLFSDIESAVEALEQVDADYQHHARAARSIAEEHFEAATVIGRMLDHAGFR